MKCFEIAFLPLFENVCAHLGVTIPFHGGKLKFIFFNILYVVAYVWGVTCKEWNRLMHSMNGNGTEFTSTKLQNHEVMHRKWDGRSFDGTYDDSDLMKQLQIISKNHPNDSDQSNFSLAHKCILKKAYLIIHVNIVIWVRRIFTQYWVQHPERILFFFQLGQYSSFSAFLHAISTGTGWHPKFWSS